jgi:branched-chain amino acid transport system ATP-binding protein
MEPDLLLLDEPAAGLNQEETEALAHYLLEIKETFGITQVLIEHQLGLVLDLADRVAVLDFGRKVAEDDPEAVARHEAVLEAYIGVGSSSAVSHGVTGAGAASAEPGGGGRRVGSDPEGGGAP